MEPKHNFRGGRTIAAGSIVCAVCMGAASIGPAFTSVDFTVSNWQWFTWCRFLYVWVLVSVGLSTLSISVFKTLQKTSIFIVVSLLAGLIASIYPSGLQLMAGTTDVVGSIHSIDTGESFKRMRVLPASKTTSTEHRATLATVSVTVKGKQQTLRVFPKDIPAELAVASKQKWEIQHLGWLNRFVLVEPVIDPLF